MTYLILLIIIIFLLISLYLGKLYYQKVDKEGYERGIEEGMTQESKRVNEKSESYSVGFGDGVLYSEASRIKTLEKLVGNPTGKLSADDFFLNEQEINKIVSQTN